MDIVARVKVVCSDNTSSEERIFILVVPDDTNLASCAIRLAQRDSENKWLRYAASVEDFWPIDYCL